MDRNFVYLNPFKKLDGTPRPIEETDRIMKFEERIDFGIRHCPEINDYIEWKHKSYYEERSRLQIKI